MVACYSAATLWGYKICSITVYVQYHITHMESDVNILKGIGIVVGKRLANAAADRAAKDFEYHDKMEAKYA